VRGRIYHATIGLTGQILDQMPIRAPRQYGSIFNVRLDTEQASEREPEYPVGQHPGGEKSAESRNRSRVPHHFPGFKPSASGEIQKRR
jgi:hypothetical protein